MFKIRRVALALGFVFALLLIALGVFAVVRGPDEEPRSTRIDKGTSWDRVEEILGKPYGTYMNQDGTLEKWHKDVDGRVRVHYDEENNVRELEYIPDNPNPSVFQRVAKWLRL